MAAIFHSFPINSTIQNVFNAISTPSEIDKWWSLSSTGKRETGETYDLFFGEPYRWKATISKLIPNSQFELTFVVSDNDWNDSKGKLPTHRKRWDNYGRISS